MPIYNYRCGNKHVFDLLQKMSDPYPPSCPECGDTNIEKMVTATIVRMDPNCFKEKDKPKPKNLTTSEWD